jgi:hypothetical protein
MFSHQERCTQELNDGQAYLEVEVPQEVVEVLAKTDDSQEKTSMIEQIEHDLDRKHNANIILQRQLRTWWIEEPVDHRTNESKDMERSETPDIEGYYPGAGFEPKYDGIAHRMSQGVDGIDY